MRDFLWGTSCELICHSDFDDAPAASGQPSGLAATEVLAQTPAAANLLAGTSSNPLDDLVSIFGSTGPTSNVSSPIAGSQANMMDAFGGLSFGGSGGGNMSGTASPAGVMSPVVASPPPQSQPQQAQDDLLGLF